MPRRDWRFRVQDILGRGAGHRDHRTVGNVIEIIPRVKDELRQGYKQSAGENSYRMQTQVELGYDYIVKGKNTRKKRPIPFFPCPFLPGCSPVYVVRKAGEILEACKVLTIVFFPVEPETSRGT